MHWIAHNVEAYKELLYLSVGVKIHFLIMAGIIIAQNVFIGVKIVYLIL